MSGNCITKKQDLRMNNEERRTKNEERRSPLLWCQLLEAPTLRGGSTSRQKLLVTMGQEITPKNKV